MVVLNKYKKIQESLGIIGRSEGIREVIEQIMSVAPTNISVLITGESGVGKEIVAKAIHQLSPRNGKQMISVNMGAIPEGLLESELFGHERGAFTGAIAMKKGYFELADGGTIFLDEIGETPLQTQVKLLRVLET
ncbi:MAG TPA: sigma-54 factor interaction domain-containing protein, partial [Caldithrix sp.]|nr:sigma-54 factor interaction domain-containing protein [Caldithrix sp.]